MLKIIRRLELKSLEQKCWYVNFIFLFSSFLDIIFRKYLLSIVDASNCEKLHQLADFFDCTPLKLTAWRVIQENKPGYSTAPVQILQELSNGVNDPKKGNNRRRMIGHGLIGPGERIYDSNYDDSTSPKAQRGLHDDSDDEDEGSISIFNTSYNGDQDTDGNRRLDHFVRPDQLPKGTPAKEVIRSWALRLQQVYQECCDLQNNSPAMPQFGQKPIQTPQSQYPNYQQQQQQQTGNQMKGTDSSRRTNNIPPPNVTRMPSLDRISDISDPQVQQVQQHHQQQPMKDLNHRMK